MKFGSLMLLALGLLSATTAAAVTTCTTDSSGIVICTSTDSDTFGTACLPLGNGTMSCR